MSVDRVPVFSVFCHSVWDVQNCLFPRTKCSSMKLREWPLVCSEARYGRSEGIGGLTLFCLLHSSQAHSGSYQQALNACYSKDIIANLPLNRIIWSCGRDFCKFWKLAGVYVCIHGISFCGVWCSEQVACSQNGWLRSC